MCKGHLLVNMQNKNIQRLLLLAMSLYLITFPTKSTWKSCILLKKTVLRNKRAVRVQNMRGQDPVKQSRTIRGTPYSALLFPQSFYELVIGTERVWEAEQKPVAQEERTWVEFLAVSHSKRDRNKLDFGT